MTQKETVLVNPVDTISIEGMQRQSADQIIAEYDQGSGQALNWCFTSYEDEVDTGELSIHYGIWQRERCPRTRRLHWQGYLEFNRYYRLQQLKSAMGSRIHFGIRRKSRESAREYCRKERTRLGEGTLHEVGITWDGAVSGNQGARTDLTLVSTAIQEGSNVADIIEKYPVQFIKFHRGIERTVQHYAYKAAFKVRDVVVKWFWGRTGCGKTHQVTEEAEDVYFKDDSIWWDNYTDQKAIVLDDFQWETVPIKRMLRILDKYRYSGQTKGGYVAGAWTKIYITSNEHPDECYPQAKDDHRAALMRRVNVIRHFSRPYRCDVTEVGGNTETPTLATDEEISSDSRSCSSCSLQLL